jgi:hypothetical protein
MPSEGRKSWHSRAHLRWHRRASTLSVTTKGRPEQPEDMDLAAAAAGARATAGAAGGRVLRQLCLPLQGLWALNCSELPWVVPDGPT